MSVVVVGYITSREGRAALAAARDEAAMRNAGLLVVRSTGAKAGDAGEAAAFADELAAIAEQFGSDRVEIREIAGDGFAGEDLVQIAEAESAVLIVIGLRRRTPVGKLILGSNAQRTLLDAHCPVLAVKAADAL